MYTTILSAWNTRKAQLNTQSNHYYVWWVQSGHQTTTANTDKLMHNTSLVPRLSSTTPSHQSIVYSSVDPVTGSTEEYTILWCPGIHLESYITDLEEEKEAVASHRLSSIAMWGKGSYGDVYPCSLTTPFPTLPTQHYYFQPNLTAHLVILCEAGVRVKKDSEPDECNSPPWEPNCVS